MSFWKNRRVLVAGGAGFIGSNLAIRLVNEGANVRVLDAMLPGLGANLFNLSEIKSRIQFIQMDLRDFELTKHHLAETEFVFNLAGNISHLDSMGDPCFDLSVNVESTVKLLEACRAVQPNAVVVFASTRQFYGPPQYLPVDERHPINPVDVNGINKYAAEAYYTLYSRVYAMKTVSLRLTNTYGPRQLISHSRQGFIGWFVNRMITRQPIQLYGGGTQERDFTYVDDVVDAMLCAATTPDCFGHVYNLSGQRTSLEALARTMIDICGRGELESVDFPPDKKRIDIGNYVGDASRFFSATHWKWKVSLNEGLKQMLSYYEKHHAHYLGRA